MCEVMALLIIEMLTFLCAFIFVIFEQFTNAGLKIAVLSNPTCKQCYQNKNAFFFYFFFIL